MTTLNELEQDALTEIFNIGVGIAADALYQMTGDHVPLSVPVVEFTNQEHAKDRYLTREQQPLYAIRQTYRGEVTTDAILMFPQENSRELVHMMVDGDLSPDEFAEVESDAMAEIGNIILNAVISNLASTLGMELDGSLPEVSLIQAQNIFSATADTAQSDLAKPVLALMIDFELSARKVRGYLAFSLDDTSSENLIRKLSQYINGSLQ